MQARLSPICITQFIDCPCDCADGLLCSPKCIAAAEFGQNEAELDIETDAASRMIDADGARLDGRKVQQPVAIDTCYVMNERDVWGRGIGRFDVGLKPLNQGLR